MKTTKIQIKGMTCAHCVRHVKQSLAAVPGVKTAEVTLEAGASVQHEGVSDERLLQAIQAAGDYQGKVVW